jgi:methyl-accepting chemotaxis protein
VVSAWLKDTSVNVKVAFPPVLGVVFLVLVGVIGWAANTQLNGALNQLTQTRMPKLAQVESLGQRLAELNAAVNQSLAWEGAGFKEAKIKTLDQRIHKDLGRYAEDLRTSSEDSELTPEQTTLLAQMQQEFDQYRKTSIDALDIKTGMLGNAASFMTVIDGHYAKLSQTLVKLRELESALNWSNKGKLWRAATPD